jgi:hypothetical protein
MLFSDGCLETCIFMTAPLARFKNLDGVMLTNKKAEGVSSCRFFSLNSEGLFIALLNDLLASRDNSKL